MSRAIAILAMLTLLATALAGCTGDNGDEPTDGEPTDTATTVPAPTSTPPGDLDAPATCPGHWHTQTAFFLHNATVPLTHVTFSYGNHVHLHGNTGNLLHYHPSPARCVPTDEAFAWLNMGMNDTAWQLGVKHGDLRGTYHQNATHKLHVFVQPWNGTWEPRTPTDVKTTQLPDGSRLLVTFGALTESDLAWQKEQVAPIPDQYVPH